MKNLFATLGALALVAAPLVAQPAEKPAKPAKPKAEKTVVAGGSAYARVFHAIPDGPAVDVYLDGQKVLTNFAFKSLSEYVPVKTGKHELKVTATGKTEALLTGDHSPTKDKYYTIIAYGDAAKPMMMIENDSAYKDYADKAKVRAYHLAPGAPAVLVTSPSTKTKAGYAKFVAKPLEFGKSSAKTVAPGTETLQIRGEDGKILKEVAAVQLEAGKRYVVYAVGKVGGAGEMALDLLVKPAAIK